MKIPLIVDTFVDQHTNQQWIEIWRNSHKEIVFTPFLPYFISDYSMKVPYETETRIRKRILGTMQEKDLYKYSFRNTRYVRQYREDDTMEADIVFTDRISIDNPEFFTKYPNTDRLKILHFDIECDTIGMFPTPERNAIIGIGCKIGDKKKLFIADEYNKDEEILHKFIDFIKETNPDILSHYNGNFFDIPYIMGRMEINHIPQDLFCRNGKKPRIYDNPYTGRTMNLGGRISFDIFHEVEKDQTIYGIKNHKMKTVAKWIDKEKKLDVVEIPLSDMRSLVNTEKLRGYLKSDVLITEFLFNIYFKNVLMLAEMNKIPLNLMVDASPSFLPQIIHGRAFQRLGIVADKNNGKRYPTYIKKKQGALVDTFRPGLYMKGIHKVDFSSQYPRIVQTFNVSPDTVRLIRYNQFVGRYTFDISDDNRYIFSIPDEKANKNIELEIDMTKRGFLAKFMDDVLNERFDIKKKMKSLDKSSTEYQYLHIRQNALKVIANVQTGYHGQEFARFGSLACYNVITGMGRYYAKMVIDYVKDAVSVDTDGIYFDKEPQVADINRYLDEMTLNTFKLKNYLHIEADNYDAAYFRKTKGKHYVLKDGEKIILHGQSFKGSHMPVFFDTVLEQTCKDMFAEKDIRKSIDVRKFSIDEIKQSIKVKSRDSYKGSGSLSVNLINQAEKQIGSRLNEGDQLNYVKTKRGYELLTPGKEYDIDYSYYEDILEKIYERLEIEDKRQWRF